MWGCVSNLIAAFVAYRMSTWLLLEAFVQYVAMSVSCSLAGSSIESHGFQKKKKEKSVLDCNLKELIPTCFSYDIYLIT